MRDMHTWTVYYSPSDYPGQFVARRFNGTQPEADHLAGPDIETVREWIYSQLPRYGGIGFQVPRYENDDPCIVECWL